MQKALLRISESAGAGTFEQDVKEKFVEYASMKPAAPLQRSRQPETE